MRRWARPVGVAVACCLEGVAMRPHVAIGLLFLPLAVAGAGPASAQQSPEAPPPPAAPAAPVAEAGAPSTSPAEGAPPDGAAAPEGGSTPAATPGPSGEPRLLVLNLTDGGAGAELTTSLSRIVAEQAAKNFVGSVLSAGELEATLGQQAAAEADGCQAEGCMADLGTRVNATRVLGGTVAKAGADVLITVVVVDPATGTLVGSEQRKVPDREELTTYAARYVASKALTGRAHDPRVPLYIAVAVDDPGARVSVDGRDEGEAPVTVLVEPGPHKVVASLPGYTSAEASVEVLEGSPSRVELSLYWERFPLWPVAASLAGLGVATVFTGLIAASVARYNYDGFFTVLDPSNSYLLKSPIDSAELSAAQGNVLLWSVAGDLLMVTGVLVLAGAAVTEAVDVTLLSLELSQDPKLAE